MNLLSILSDSNFRLQRALGYYEHLVTTNKFLCTKIIDSYIQLFG